MSLAKHCAWFVIYIRPYFPLDTLPSSIWLTSFFGGILKNYRKRKIAFMHVIKKYPISFCHLPSAFSSHAAKTFQCSFNLKIMELLVDFEIANASGLSNLIVILLMMMICAKVFQRDELRWDAIPMRWRCLKDMTCETFDYTLTLKARTRSRVRLCVWLYCSCIY